jgi:hypothetical protein
MTESPAISALIQRLAIGRLAAPGRLQRHELQRTHDRFSHPPGAHVLGRLFRRIEFAEPSATGLLLARADASIDQDAVPSAQTDASTQAASVVSADHPATRAETTVGGTSSVVTNRLARRTPGVTQSGRFVARKVAATPGVIASSHVVQRLVARAGDSLRSPTDAAGDAARTMSAPASRAAGSIASAPASQQRVMRKAEAAIAAAATGHTPDGHAGSSAVDSYASTSALVGVRSPMFTTQRPVAATLQRSPGEPIVRAMESRPQSGDVAGPRSLSFEDSAQPGVFASSALVHTNTWASAATAKASNGANAIGSASPLVLRKADVTVVSPAAAKQLPTISTAQPRVIAREVAATPHAQSMQHAAIPEMERPEMDRLDIIRIAELVESRLGRRLEIERERQGVRQWRTN